MIELRESIRVATDFDTCVRYMSDFSFIEQWDPGSYRGEKLTEAAPAPGTTFDITLALPGKPKMRYTLDAMSITAEKASFELSGKADNFSATDVITLTQEDGLTRVDYAADLVFHDFRRKLGFIFGPLMRRMGRKTVAGLEQALQVSSLPIKAKPGWGDRLRQRLVVPHVLSFGHQGYARIENKGLCFSMQGKVVLITGPTAGIGWQTAIHMAQMGAELILVGRDESKLEAVKTRALAEGAAGVSTYSAELTSIPSSLSTIAAIKGDHETIDVVINNAGALFDTAEYTEEKLERSAAVDFFAPYLFMTQLLPTLIKANGRVINVSSGGMYLQSLQPTWLEASHQFEKFDGAGAYASAKRALVLLGQQLQQEMPDVAIHSMHPGWVDTPGVEKSLPEFRKKMAKRLRDLRMGADTIVFLAAHPALGPKGEHPEGFWFDRKMRPIDLLGRTKVTTTQVDTLRAQVDNFLAPHLADFNQ